MPDINYHHVIADLEQRANQMLDHAAGLRDLMGKGVLPGAVTNKSVEALKPPKPDGRKTPQVTVDGQIVPISKTIERFVDGTRTAIEIADCVEPLYPGRDGKSTRDNVSTQLSGWLREGKIRKDDAGRIAWLKSPVGVRG